MNEAKPLLDINAIFVKVKYIVFYNLYFMAGHVGRCETDACSERDKGVPFFVQGFPELDENGCYVEKICRECGQRLRRVLRMPSVPKTSKQVGASELPSQAVLDTLFPTPGTMSAELFGLKEVDGGKPGMRTWVAPDFLSGPNN